MITIRGGCTIEGIPLREAIAEYQVAIYLVSTAALGILLAAAIDVAMLDIYGSAEGILLYLAYMLGPAIVAVLMLAVLEGPAGVIDLFAGFLRWRAGGAYWYLLAAFFTLAAELLAMEAYVLVSGGLPAGFTLSALPWNTVLNILLTAFGLTAGLGYVLPQLLRTRTPLFTAVAAAAFLIAYRSVTLAHDPNFAVMCVGLAALALVLVWAYVNARNSLPVMAIFLFTASLASNLFSYRIAAYAGSALPIYLSKLAFIGIMAVVLLLHRYLAEY